MEGLRERKRMAMIRRIQLTALDLFDRYGYQQVSVERIAAAAEVSPSSVYRHFGTKERLVLWDEYDPVALQQLAEELPRLPPMAAVRLAMTSMLNAILQEEGDRVRRRVRYMVEEPAVAAASAVEALQMAEAIAAMLADGLGRDQTDAQVHLFAYGFVGAVMGALRYWYASGFRASLPDLVDQVVDSLEHGFQLGR